jgi:polar amino acid transport system substrate-binding protein
MNNKYCTKGSALLTAGVFALTGLALVSTGAIAETTMEKIKRTGVMTAGNSGSYPPFEIMQGKTLVGFDIDMANELGRRMGVKVKFEVIDFKGIIAALKSKRVDTLITAMTKTPGRAKQILFSIAYYDAGIGALTAKGAGIMKPEDLTGKIVGVQLGSSGERFVRSKLGKKVKQLKTYDAILLAVQDLKIGRVAAVVNPIPVLRYNSKGANLVTSPIWQRRAVGINARKEDDDLMDWINKHLSDMKKEGVLKRLDKKWFEG